MVTLNLIFNFYYLNFIEMINKIWFVIDLDEQYVAKWTYRLLSDACLLYIVVVVFFFIFPSPYTMVYTVLSPSTGTDRVLRPMILTKQLDLPSNMTDAYTSSSTPRTNLAKELEKYSRPQSEHTVSDSPTSILYIRGWHLKYSVTKWKYGPCSFDLLRKVIQGQQFLCQFWTPRKVWWKISHLKEGRPWMNFLNRPNEGRRFFQFAIEIFKRRPLI